MGNKHGRNMWTPVDLKLHVGRPRILSHVMIRLRVVNENTITEEEWLKWAERAIQSYYGYEYQGDNLLIACINVLLSFYEYFIERWKHELEKKTLNRIANIISWNIWQMDGLKDTVPLGKPYEENQQMTLFDFLEYEENNTHDIPW